ncbi:MAG: phosphate-starvation-inducible PsiE family protein [Leptolyngbyaceae cyanobacterium]
MQINSDHRPSLKPFLARRHIVKSLEFIQDSIVVSICIGLFCSMLIQLWMMFNALLPPLNFSVVTSDILFLLILVELFRLLIIYLQEHEISIGVAVEVSIVSVLREVIVHGVLETDWSQVLAACAFIGVLSLLLMIRCSFMPARLIRKFQGSQSDVAESRPGLARETCCG